MASLSTSKNGEKRIRFKGMDGQRRSIRLGRLSKKNAEIVRNYVGRLETAQQVGNVLDTDTLNWLSRISDWLHTKLAQVGLVAERETATLGNFIDLYIKSKAIKKPNTAKNYQTTRKSLLDFFGSEKPIASITAGDCDDWYEKQVADKYASATIGRNVKRARQFFRAAVRRKLISENPMQDVKAAAQVNKSREFFVTRDMIEKVIEACPNAEFRLIVALARYAGLRTPSEILTLTWGEVNWENNRIRITSTKTEHHDGKGYRVIPLFPELRPYLEAVFDQAEPGTKYVITRYRDGNANLRTQLVRIIERAGVKQWPRIFQNLRSSRETELTEEYPIQVACAWIGNSEAVAKKHYLQVTEEHFQRAIASGRQSGGSPIKNSGHGLAHGPSVTGQNASYQETQNPIITENYGVLPYCTNEQVPPRGVEPLFSD